MICAWTGDYGKLVTSVCGIVARQLLRVCVCISVDMCVSVCGNVFDNLNSASCLLSAINLLRCSPVSAN